MGRAGFAAVGGLALLAAAAAQLTSLLYFRAAERALAQDRPTLALRAAQLSARLAPWDDAPPALQGWIHAEALRFAEAEAAYQRALRLAPGDARLWSEYAQARARLGLFDGGTAAAVEAARRRAPVTPSIQRAIAEQGLAYWERGDPALQALWLAAMRERLAAARGEFLSRVLTRGRLQPFCAGPAAAAGEAAWCATAAALQGCFDVGRDGPVPCRR